MITAKTIIRTSLAVAMTVILLYFIGGMVAGMLKQIEFNNGKSKGLKYD